MTIIKNLLIIPLLMTIYMNDGSYVWVDKVDTWATCPHCENFERTCSHNYPKATGIKYTLANVTHYIPFSNIKEITTE